MTVSPPSAWLRLALALVVLAMPATGTTPLGHAGEDHCSHEHTGGHPGALTTTESCQSNDACRECPTPACRMTDHCGPSIPGLLGGASVSQAAASAASLPVTFLIRLVSVASPPPTQPPR